MIEILWKRLEAEGNGQIRVDDLHPHEIYADFQLPSYHGLVVLSHVEPPSFKAMRSVCVETGRRTDGRWAIRMQLRDHALLPVFASLCGDIVSATRSGVSASALPQAVMRRLGHWRTLMEGDASGLAPQVLRGLIGELEVLEHMVMPLMPHREAVRCWIGPEGAPQDFLLPCGRRIEVKSTTGDSKSVRINGLEQLDAGADPITLAVVRMDKTGVDAPDAVTATDKVAWLRDLLEPSDALHAFNARLSAMGWHEHPAHEQHAVRIGRTERYDVDLEFPRLTRVTLPRGVDDIEYTVQLPEEWT